jgi:hypothetical protein
MNFATGVQNSSSTAIGNIFIDIMRLSSSCTSSTVNGISDCDAQFLTINNLTTKVKFTPLKQRTRKINETIAQF